MAVTTGYYIQRLSDGKILAGSGANSVQGGFNSEDWFELTNSGQLNTQAYWEIVDLTQPYSSYSYILENLVDSLPQQNGDWQQDLFRFLPIQKNV
jgi:hypothetical protein